MRRDVVSLRADGVRRHAIGAEGRCIGTHLVEDRASARIVADLAGARPDVVRLACRVPGITKEEDGSNRCPNISFSNPIQVPKALLKPAETLQQWPVSVPTDVDGLTMTAQARLGRVKPIHLGLYRFIHGEVTSVATQHVAHNVCAKAVPRRHKLSIRVLFCIGCDLGLSSYHTLVHSDSVNTPLHVVQDDVFISALITADPRADCIDQ